MTRVIFPSFLSPSSRSRPDNKFTSTVRCLHSLRLFQFQRESPPTDVGLNKLIFTSKHGKTVEIWKRPGPPGQSIGMRRWQKVGTHGLRRVQRTSLVEGNRELKLDGQILSVAVIEQSEHS